MVFVVFVVDDCGKEFSLVMSEADAAASRGATSGDADVTPWDFETSGYSRGKETLWVKRKANFDMVACSGCLPRRKKGGTSTFDTVDPLGLPPRPVAVQFGLSCHYLQSWCIKLHSVG